MSSLETSVTLEDVFNVALAKRVPLAPELAGYLSLEIADGADPGGGEVEPKTVFISEEGTVALVRPKDKVGAGDAEASVRGILTKLLEASGSSTPALSAASKRKPVAGLPALVEELEAALIPVNRAAGRRALARLAREVKRVTMGVGRNASVPPPSNRPAPASQPQAPAPRIQKIEKKTAPPPVPPKEEKKEEEAPPASLDISSRGRVGSFSDEAVTAKRPNQLAEVAASVEVLPATKDERKTEEKKKSEPPAPTPPTEALTRDPGKVETTAPPAAAPRAPLPPPPMRGGSPVAAPPAPQRTGPHEKVGSGLPAPVGPPGAPDKTLFKGDEVDSLLASFEVAGGGEKEMSRDLKAIAGLDPTPPPPDAKTLDELTRDVGQGLPKISNVSKPDGDSVEALLALSEQSGPLPTPAPIIPLRTVGNRGGAEAPISLAPPSPLVPSAMLGASQPAAPSSTPRLPEPAPDPARSTRSLPSGPNLPPAASQSSRRERVVEQVAEATAKRPKRGPNEPPRAPKTGLAMLVIALVVLGAGAGAIYKMNPAFFTGKKKPLPVPTADVDAGPAVPALTQCKVALVVTDVPANAEVLLRVGQAPLDVERMPVGTRLEFVATAEGYAPRRTIVKPEAIWDKTPEGRARTDLAVQLDPSRAKPGQLDPWPAAEPGSQVGGSGSPGTVHVISSPRGAEIWLLAGLGPEARIEQLKCDGDIDVLLAGPASLRKRLHVPEKDIEATTETTPGNKVVTISAK